MSLNALKLLDEYIDVSLLIWPLGMKFEVFGPLEEAK